MQNQRDREKRIRSAYDTLKGTLTGLSVDNLRFSYLLHQLDFMYEELLNLLAENGVVPTATSKPEPSPVSDATSGKESAGS